MQKFSKNKKKNIKILTIVGARPQFIKSSVISNEIKKNYKYLKEILVHTGQHYDFNMNKVFFNELKIKRPNYYLNISKLDHITMITKMISAIDKIIKKEKPNFVLVYGDTNSTVSGAIAAYKNKTKIIHIEAGLRSYNENMPEEQNRIITDRLSNLLFCPTLTSKKNLIYEGYEKHKNKKILNYGDVMYDLHLKFKKKFHSNIDYKDYYLLTIHREENMKKKKLKNIFRNIIKLSNYKKIVFPTHPRIKKLAKQNLKNKNIMLIEPKGYFEFGSLLNNSFAVITDSGGVQKESFFFEKNCFVLRNETEWVELIKKNVNLMISPDKKDFFKKIINHKFSKKTDNFFPFGNGKSSRRIVKEIFKDLNNKKYS
jgi:UDP-GlcNAc3NAcA epimerase